MLEAYLALMQLRMGERLQVALNLPAELRGIELPPLLVVAIPPPTPAAARRSSLSATGQSAPC